MIQAQKIEFLGLIVDSLSLFFSLPETKVTSVIDMCFKALALDSFPCVR